MNNQVSKVLPRAKQKRGFSQGIFIPANPHKCQNKEPVVYRSAWEARFLRYIDNNPNVLIWLSETYSISYLCPTDNKMHKYYPDFFIKILKEDNTQENILIEIKPECQTIPPKNNKRKKPETYLTEFTTWKKNEAKWKFAVEWCKKHNFTFKIMNEYDLGIKSRK